MLHSIGPSKPIFCGWFLIRNGKISYLPGNNNHSKWLPWSLSMGGAKSNGNIGSKNINKRVQVPWKVLLLFLVMYMCVCAQFWTHECKCLHKPVELHSLAAAPTVVTGGCEPPWHACWGSTLVPLEEQYMLLNTEPSLHPLMHTLVRDLMVTDNPQNYPSTLSKLLNDIVYILLRGHRFKQFILGLLIVFYLCFAWMYVCVSWGCSAHGGQRRVIDPK